MIAGKKIVLLHVALSESLNRLIEKSVRRGTHASKSELIREAIREKLKSMGFNAYPKTRTPKDVQQNLRIKKFKMT